MGKHLPGRCACGRATTRKAHIRCRECVLAATKGTNPSLKRGLTVHGEKAEAFQETHTQVRTLADLIRVCNIDTDEWTIERWVANKWEIGSLVDGKILTKPLFQVKAFLTRNRPVLDAKARIAELVTLAKKAIPARAGARRNGRVSVSSCLLELAIPDLHLGKLAWGPETGYADYDARTAEALYLAALDTLLRRTAAFTFDKIVLPVGHDLFHSDTMAGTTTKGTPLDNDSRYHKTFMRGYELLVKAIERVRQIAPVIVPIVPGNHDQLSAWHVGHSLDCFYHRTPHVEIMNEPIPRKYVEYGSNLLLFTHGDKGKIANLPLLMATERSEAFGRCRFREAHIGHRHESKVQEYMGVRVRTSPALCAPDSWHSENHFVGNLQGAEALVWSKDEGMVASAFYTVPEA